MEKLRAYHTKKELRELADLRIQLQAAKSHSPEAVKFGRQIAAIYQLAALRQPRDRAMEAFSKRFIKSLS